MKILIYGGSFNPPHIGHVHALRVTAEALHPDRIMLIPASLPPHKKLAENSASVRDRLAMTEQAAREIPGAEVLDIEMRRPGKSYTSDTLRQLNALFPDDELIFLVGTDMLLTLDTWHEPEIIMSLAHIAVFAREHDRTEDIIAKRDELRRRYGAEIYIISGEPVEVSSTELREGLARRECRELVPAGVYEHIIRNRLYNARPDYGWMREKAYAYLKAKRVKHVRGVEQEARKLAERWGLDEDDAAEAAICHDITKKLDLTEQLRLCAQYGIVPDSFEQVSEKLLHAKTGAAFSQELFGLSDEAAAAIRWHTTGRAGMDELQKVIYLADYIEPGREGFAGLAELRRAAYEDLDAAMELGMRMTIQEVRDKGNPVHPDTDAGHADVLARMLEKGLTPIHVDGVPDSV